MSSPQTFPQMFRLDGKVAVVTGGARGLGLAMATGLAEAGAEVVLADRLKEEGQQSARSLTALGHKAHYREVDVADRDSVFSLMKAVSDSPGGVDILINNAGVGSRSHEGPHRAQDMPPEHWRTLISVNLDGPFWCCQAAYPSMKARGGGSIVNISSIWGLAAGGAFPVAGYAASKAGLANLTRQLAVEWAPDGIRVNAIAPGVFRTSLGGKDPLWAETWRDYVFERMPLRRIGEPEELKGAAIFLASEASCLVTGQVLAVDGGWLAW
ncbi:MAG: SDR family NAD(P)-dependent oxidoreductase [Nitrospinota bacterium]